MVRAALLISAVLGIFLGFTIATFLYDYCNANNTSLIKLYKVSLKTCSVGCFCTEGCAHIHYNRLVQECSLHVAAVTGSYGNCGGIATHLKFLTTWYKIDRNMCSKDILFCPELERGNGTTLYGNMRHVGARRKIGCIRHDVINGTNATQCLEIEEAGSPTQEARPLTEGAWPPLGHCVQTCPPPSFRSNIVCLQISQVTEEGRVTMEGLPDAVSAADYWEGSTMLVQCANNNASVNDSSARELTTCKSGLWTNFPVCPGSVGQPCDTADDCVDLDTECRSGLCGCKFGLSYHRSRSACVKSCRNYGNTFQRVASRYVLWGFDKLCTYENMTGFDDCLALCLSQTEYVCKTGEYEQISLTYENRTFYRNECCLRDLVNADINPAYFRTGPASVFTYLQRDCL